MKLSLYWLAAVVWLGAVVLSAGCDGLGCRESVPPPVCTGAGVTTSCGDSNVCNGVETCGANGECQAGTALDCDDSDSATVDRCIEATGCFHLGWTETNDLDLQGNAIGGTAFRDICPDGQVMRGVAGSIGDSFDQIQVVCGIPSINADLGVTLADGMILPLRGQNVKTPEMASCPPDQMLVGFEGRAGALLDQLVLRCAPVQVELGAIGYSFSVGDVVTVAPIGGNGGVAFAAMDCDPGEIVIGANIQGGGSIDAFGLACGSPNIISEMTPSPPVLCEQAGDPICAFWVQVAAGEQHSCALDDSGAIACWGNNEAGQANVPGNLGTTTLLATGFLHMCAVSDTGTVACWGANLSGQTDVPATLGTITSVSAGSAHTCAVDNTGVVTCWGDNTSGQATVPTGLGTITSVSAGPGHTCALDNTGVVTCWGDNTSGQTTVPTGLGTITSVSAGSAHTCALDNTGVVTCWGDNTSGQTTVPTGLGTVTGIAAGEHATTCVFNDAGVVTCWGDSLSTQPSVLSSVPDNMGTVIGISVGLTHACAVNYAGVVTCWGLNLFGAATSPASI